MAVNNQSRYPLPVRQSKRPRISRIAGVVGSVGVAAFVVFLLIPQIVTLEIKSDQTHPVQISQAEPFPVSVDPATKSIVENPEASAIFAQQADQSTAAVTMASQAIDWFVALISNTPLYQSLAAVDGHVVIVHAGDRKEQVLGQLAYDMNWNKAQQQEFLTAVQSQTPGISDGMFSPGTYVVQSNMTPSNVAALMNLSFSNNILLHYSSTTAAHVPLKDALIVASMLERETGGPNDERIISGIIWNRLFDNMNLQIDATLQYAKGDKSGNWWSQVVPKDKYIKSPYNTYEHPGLPPGPIAEPSVAAVIAALNPVQTSCLYYFHDKYGRFHCSDTYPQHVKLLRKYYGQGK